MLEIHSRYTKFGIILASNAFVYTNTKSPHFCESGNEGFLLVEALPQSPQNTILCSGNAGNVQRLRDLICKSLKWASTPVLFRFSLRGERIVPKNPFHICFGGLEGTHFIFRLLVLCVHSFFLRQELGIFGLQAFDGGQLFQALFIKKLLCRLMKYDLRLMLGKEFLGVASLSIGNIGVAGLGVVDDVLLQNFDFRHAL